VVAFYVMTTRGIREVCLTEGRSAATGGLLTLRFQKAASGLGGLGLVAHGLKRRRATIAVSRQQPARRQAMIVKLKDRSGDVHLIDGVANVHFGEPVQWNGVLSDRDAPTFQSSGKLGTSEPFLSCGFKDEARLPGDDPQLVEYYRMTCQRDDGVFFCLEIGFEAYIMNDRGKTIEALRLL
jgi:hypothetical protein